MQPPAWRAKTCSIDIELVEIGLISAHIQSGAFVARDWLVPRKPLRKPRVDRGRSKSAGYGQSKHLRHFFIVAPPVWDRHASWRGDGKRLCQSRHHAGGITVQAAGPGLASPTLQLRGASPRGWRGIGSFHGVRTMDANLI